MYSVYQLFDREGLKLRNINYIKTRVGGYKYKKVTVTMHRYTKQAVIYEAIELILYF